jgi:Fe-S-cluster containining protein
MISRELSNSILVKYDEISKVFGEFQNSTQLTCPPGCGRCCFKPDISCSPYELLPMAFHLLDNGKAEKFLARALENKDKQCIFLDVTDEAGGKAKCSDYAYRPFICRAFGVSARHGKRGTEFSICKTIKNNDQFTSDFSHAEDSIPYIEIWKKRLETIDPVLLDKEIPINESLAIILEKVLLWNSYQQKAED